MLSMNKIQLSVVQKFGRSDPHNLLQAEQHSSSHSKLFIKCHNQLGSGIPIHLNTAYSSKEYGISSVRPKTIQSEPFVLCFEHL